LIVGSYISYIFFVSYIYRSSRLSDIYIITRVALQFIYSTWIFISRLFR